MKVFRARIEMENDGMKTLFDVSGALADIRLRLADGQRSGTIRDANGNRVGFFEVYKEVTE